MPEFQQTEITREAHMTWCKERAMEYAVRGDKSGCTMSFLSDIGKHPDTADLGSVVAMTILVAGDSPNALIHWVEGWA